MVQRAIETMTAPSFNKPADLGASAMKMEEKKWEIAYEEYRRDQRIWEEVEPRAFQLFMSHCDEEKEQKLMTLEGWEQINDDQDIMKLLSVMRSIAHKHDEVNGGTMNMVDQDVRLYVHSFQKDHESILEYYKRFTAQCD